MYRLLGNSKKCSYLRYKSHMLKIERNHVIKNVSQLKIERKHVIKNHIFRDVIN